MFYVYIFLFVDESGDSEMYINYVKDDVPMRNMFSKYVKQNCRVNWNFFKYTFINV